MQFAARQNNAVVRQEQEEQSFQLSEAGVNYVLHLLNNGLCTPAELNASEPVIQSVVDVSVQGSGAFMGTYELAFDVQPAGSGTVTSVQAIGYDINVQRECQLIEAKIESFDGVLGTKYRVKSWDHKSTITCGTPGAVVNPVC